VTAATFSNVEEAIGFARAAKAAEVPCVISMVAKDGKLNDGAPLASAVTRIDAATAQAPLYYMVNCTHPTEIEVGLTEGDWTNRLGGFLPNAVAMELLSLCSLGHLEDGDPGELGGQMAALSMRFPHVHVWGGCCGTDGRHIAQIARQVSEARTSVAA